MTGASTLTGGLGATTMSGVLAMGSNKITGLATGTASGDAIHLGQYSPTAQAGADDSVGEIDFPNGFQMKWGDKAIAGLAAVAIDFTDEGLTDFDNAIFQAYVTTTSGVDGDFGMAVTAIATTGITIHNSDGQQFTARWFAIGR